MLGQDIFKISGQIVKSLQKHSQITPWKIFQMQQPPIATGQNPHLKPSKCNVGYCVTPAAARHSALAPLTTLLAKTEPLTLHTVDSSKLRICSPFLRINALSLSCGSQKHPQPLILYSSLHSQVSIVGQCAVCTPPDLFKIAEKEGESDFLVVPYVYC